MVRRLALLGFVAAAACSSSSDDDALRSVKVGEVRANEVWKDGLELGGKITVYPGATVEIDPGARIRCSDSAELVVAGTLRVRASANHATITCQRWPGIVVAQGGQIDVEGLDIENADVGYLSSNGAGTVNIVDASILTSVRPVQVNQGSLVTLTHVKATTPAVVPVGLESKLEIKGKLVAKYLEYNASGHEGIWLSAGGEAEIEDATLVAKNGFDLVSSRGGKSLKVRYTTLRGGHCGPHLEGIGSFEFDHVTSEDNLFGITIYAASVEGPHVVRDSNLNGAVAWLDIQGDHGPITFENVFPTGAETIKNTSPPTISRATAKIEDAQPR